MRRAWWVGGALILSVATNGYLLFGTESAPTDAVRKPRATRPNVPSPPSRVEVPVQIVRAERATLEARLAAAEARLTALRPLDQQFERNEPNPDAEARMQPHLDRLFAGHEYTLACRGDVCEITWSHDEAMSDFQSDSGMSGMFDGMQIGPRGAIVRLADPAQHRGVQSLTAPIYAMLASPALAECKRTNPTEGRLAMSLQVVMGKYIVRAEGPFAKQAIGVCIRKALEDITATIKPTVENTDPMPFPVPLG